LNSTKPRTRVYHSELRKEKAEETRERILEGLVKVMAQDGIAELSIPHVAQASGVSVPSVYRYFPNKRDLIAALDGYAQRKGAFTSLDLSAASTPDELAEIIPIAFKRREAIETTIVAAMNSRLGIAIRRPDFIQRAKHIRRALGPATKNLSRTEKQWLNDIVFVLNSYSSVRAFRDYLGLDTDEAGQRVAWAVRLLTRAVAASEQKAKKSK
jgi:AcrR family transcriptional regulator